MIYSGIQGLASVVLLSWNSLFQSGYSKFINNFIMIFAVRNIKPEDIEVAITKLKEQTVGDLLLKPLTL